MNVRAAVLLLLLLLQACAAAPRADQKVTAPPVQTRRSVAPQPSSEVQRHWTEREAKLQALLAELARPPFGSGAALTVLRGSASRTLVAGELWDDGPLVTANSRFNVASVSKLLTASRIVRLAHDARLNLDDPLKNHLPGVTMLDRQKRDRSVEISLRQLLGHRAGLPSQPAGLEAKLKAVGATWVDPAVYEKLMRSWSVELAVEPGRYRYGNFAYALLAAVIERTEQCRFADCMASHLVTLGMANATFLPHKGMADAAHGRVAAGNKVVFNDPGWYLSRYGMPYTGLWTSTAELARFGQALVSAASDESASLRAMSEPLGAGGGHGVGAVQAKRLGERSLEHDGSSPGFRAWLVAIPERNAVLAVACNGGGERSGSNQRFAEIVSAMVEAALAE